MEDGIHALPPDLLRDEAVPRRWTALCASPVVSFLLYSITLAFLVTIIVLVGVMLGRGDSDVTAAVRTLFRKTDSEREPMLPAWYLRQRRPAVAIVAGDAWAAGEWNQALQLPGATVFRATAPNATAATVQPLLAAALIPNAALQNQHVALIVQAGINDLLRAQANGSLAALDIGAVARALFDGLRLFHIAQLSRAASVRVFIVDYPDASAGTGYTALQCEPPYDAIYNRIGASAAFVDALAMLSQALFTGAHEAGFAFVPLRDTLANVGSADVVHALSPLHRDFLGVDGTSVQPDAIAAFTDRCGALGRTGQAYQAQLLNAHIAGRAYWVVG